VQTGGNDIKIIRSIVSRARIALRGTSSLEVHPRAPFGIGFSQDVLALNGEWPSSLELDSHVWSTLNVEALAMHSSQASELIAEMLLCDPATYRHLETSGSGNHP
jgi:hypothetical protein